MQSPEPEGKSTAKTQILKHFVQYVITQGQDLASHLYYTRLPQPLQQADQILLAQVGSGSENNRAASSPPEY